MDHQHKFASAFCKKFSSASTEIDGISQRLGNDRTASSFASFFRSIIDSDLETSTKREKRENPTIFKLPSIGTINHSNERNSQTVSAQHNLGGRDEYKEMKLCAGSNLLLVWELLAGQILCVFMVLCAPLVRVGSGEARGLEVSRSRGPAPFLGLQKRHPHIAFFMMDEI